MTADKHAPEAVAVLDMGASAIRLVIAEVAAGRSIRVVEEASRGVLLGRDTFSGGAIRSKTVDAALAALEGFRRIIDGYGVHANPRGGDQRGPRGAQRRAVPRSHSAAAPASRSKSSTRRRRAGCVYLAVARALRAPRRATRRLDAARPRSAAAARASRCCAQGQPNRSGVYALGAVRLRQQLNLRRLTHDVQLALLEALDRQRRSTRFASTIPLDRVTHMVAIGGDVRFAASQILGAGGRRRRARDSRARRSSAFCDDSRAAGRGQPGRIAFGCRRSRPRRWCRRCWSTGRCCPRPRRDSWSSPMRRCGPACCSTCCDPAAGLSAGTSSARCWRAPRRSGHGTGSIGRTAVTSRCSAMRLFDELRGRPRPRRTRAAAAAGRRAAARHRHLREPARAPQALAVPARGVADLRPVRRRDGDRVEHRALPPARRCRSRATCRTSPSIAATA